MGARMSVDEFAVLRWLRLTSEERSASSMGAPTHALERVAARLRSGAKVAKELSGRRADIILLARPDISVQSERGG
jgi:hypothetical protein